MAQDALRTSILSTLALAEAERCPALSCETIAAYLHRAPMTPPDDAAVARACGDLAQEHRVRTEHGHYALTSDTHAFRILRERNGMAKKKLERNKIPLFFLQLIPFLEGAAITGSIAMDNATSHSDVDIFCIVKKGRIWTVRALSLACAALFLRRRDRTVTGEKLCFNYFLAQDAYAPVRNIASANMFARAIPLFERTSLDRFFSTNAWIARMLRFPGQEPFFPAIPTLRAIERALSFLLSGTFGDRVEALLKQWQLRRLERKATQEGDTSHLILRDDALLLHYPDIKNKKVMELYEQRMRSLGIAKLF